MISGKVKTQLVDTEGRSVRLQLPNFGHVVGLGEADFTMEDSLPFLIKNDNEESVTLEVIPAGGEDYVETIFAVGWNPEIVKAIKTTQSGGSLLWGW